MAKPLPMFPLGTVLFPTPRSRCASSRRYRTLVETCLRGDGRFGVVLIERGYEVGGGDERFGVGTIARIVEAARTPMAATCSPPSAPTLRIRSGSTTIPCAPRSTSSEEPERVPAAFDRTPARVQRLLAGCWR
jgi:hypothetical protein